MLSRLLMRRPVGSESVVADSRGPKGWQGEALYLTVGIASRQLFIALVEEGERVE